MGTRSLTIFTEDINDEKAEICVLYRQMDGYPSGHGKDLKKCLEKGKIGNGIPGGLNLEDGSKFFNGMGDLVVQTITRLKTIQTEHTKEWRSKWKEDGMAFVNDVGDCEPGGFYLHQAGTRDCWEDYTYYIYPKDNLVYIQIHGYNGQIYDGPVDELDPVEVEKADSDEEE